MSGRRPNGWKKAKTLTTAANAARRMHQMVPSLDDSKPHWVAFAVELELPMGLGFDKDHRVSEIKAEGSAAVTPVAAFTNPFFGKEERYIQIGDWLTHFDGVDLRLSGQSIVEVLDRSLSTHRLVLQRMMIHPRHRKNHTTLTVRLAPINGTMGVGLDANHCVTAIYRGGAADRDGRLQVGDQLLAMDGVDITDFVSLVDVLDPQRSPHQLIVCRRNELIEYAQRDGADTELIQFTVTCPSLMCEDGRRRMGIGANAQNAVTELDPDFVAKMSGELQVGCSTPSPTPPWPPSPPPPRPPPLSPPCVLVTYPGRCRWATGSSRPTAST